MARRLIRVLVRLAVVATVAVVTLAAAHTSVNLTSVYAGPAIAQSATSAYDQRSCLEAALRHSVPKGARVHVYATSVVDYDLLVEIITLWARPGATAAAAQWIVSLKTEPDACMGLQLQAVHRK